MKTSPVTFMENSNRHNKNNVIINVTNKNDLFEFCDFSWSSSDKIIIIHKNALGYENVCVYIPVTLEGCKVIDERVEK